MDNVGRGENKLLGVAYEDKISNFQNLAVNNMAAQLAGRKHSEIRQKLNTCVFLCKYKSFISPNSVHEGPSVRNCYYMRVKVLISL